MRNVSIKVTVPVDRRLVVQLPEDVEPGEATITIIPRRQPPVMPSSDKKCSMAAAFVQRKRRNLVMTLPAILTAIMTFESHPRPLLACGPLPAVIQVSPPLGVQAPQNTTVLVYFPLRWQTRYLKAAAQLPMQEVLVVLRAIGSSEPVKIRRSDTQQGIHTVVELRPCDLLQPGDYELVVTVAEQSTVVGEINVGHVLDRTAPRFRARPRAQFVNDYATLFAQAGTTLCQSIGPEDDCEVFPPEIMFARTSAQDDQTPPAAIRLALWVNPEQGAIDYDRAPMEYLFRRLPYFQFLDLDVRHLWGGKSCAELPLSWRNPTSIRIGVRPIDLAGNRGTAWEALVTERDKVPGEKLGSSIFIRTIKPAARKAVPASRLAPFAKAIARSIAAHRWPLAVDECEQARHSTGSMPEACRELAAQGELTGGLPIDFLK